MDFCHENILLENADSLSCYDKWGETSSPVVIMADGPYGVSGYDGDLDRPEGLAEWYEPHIQKWAEHSSPLTTLWFWNTEVGWATVHPILLKHGWIYRGCSIWNKGLSHIAGNVNTNTIRRLPPITEVVVQYVREPVFECDGAVYSLQDWMRDEWKRTGIPFAKANEACGVKNAATRKYLTGDHVWYFPPEELFQKLVDYANKYGVEEGKPYFTLDGKTSLTADKWSQMRSKFKCEHGLTNIFEQPPVRGRERIQLNGETLHPNQKPLSIIETLVRITSDEGDDVWEPFAGTATTAVASRNLKRGYLGAEINRDMFSAAVERLQSEIAQTRLW